MLDFIDMCIGVVVVAFGILLTLVGVGVAVCFYRDQMAYSECIQTHSRMECTQLDKGQDSRIRVKQE